MKEIMGIWFPDTDAHFEEQLAVNPFIGGKGTYQYKKYQAALPHVKNRRLAVDIGAHVGLWSRVMARDFRSVSAFEPIAEHIECFRANLNGAKHVTMHPVALSDGAAVKMDYVADNTGHTHAAPNGRKVRTMRLDDFGLKGIDFLKIDVEGYELPVIRGGEQTIRREKPVVVIEQKPNGDAERYGRGRFDALEQLKAWGARQVWELGGDFCLTWE